MLGRVKIAKNCPLESAKDLFRKVFHIALEYDIIFIVVLNHKTQHTPKEEDTMNELEMSYYEMYEADNGFDAEQYQEAYNENKESDDYE